MTDAATRLTALAERIELWPVDPLRPYERNPRTHNKDQVAQLAASIIEFGFTNPILVDETNGILAGHGRLMAARQLGLAEVLALLWQFEGEPMGTLMRPPVTARAGVRLWWSRLQLGGWT